METGIRIDQALFGYREGHRLLQASRKFTPGAERTLLILTDMSGPRTVEGFEEYLTGYPLDGEDCYAVVKTWYAPEMERPGCVWSHVLLVGNSDLAFIQNVSSLLPLFNRPAALDSEQYRASLWLQRSFTEPMHGQVSYPGELLAALYGQDNKPIIIPAHDSHAFQATVLGIWSQQWPALRRCFAFCTGSLSNRTIAGQSFDLQVAPLRMIREFQRDSDGFVLDINFNALQNSSFSASWVLGAVDDLATNGGPLRTFLWMYADARVGGRSLFAKLTELFGFLQSSQLIPDSEEPRKLSALTQQIASIYPSSSSGATLKQDFYGYRMQEKAFWAFKDERAILAELATTAHYESLDGSQLELRLRAKEGWYSDHDYAQSLLFSLLDRSTTPFADEVIAGFVDAMSAEDVCQIATLRSGLLLALVVRNPKILSTSEFWRCSRTPDTYYGILDYLKTDEAAGVSRDWISYAIENGPNELAVPLVEGFAAETVQAILHRATSSTTDSEWIPTPSWRAALSIHQSVLVAFLDRTEITSSTRAMTLLAGLLDSHEVALKTYGLNPWLELAREAKDLILEFPNADAAAFFLSLGFTHSQREAINLIALCFEHAHAAAHSGAHDPLSYRAWKVLERDVPTLSRTRNWDKCERLRQALIDRFIRNRWPRLDFLKCASRPETLRGVFYSCRDVRGGEDFILAVAEDVLTGVPVITEAQRSVFESGFRRNWRGEFKFDL